jgi:hypothetical protein
MHKVLDSIPETAKQATKTKTNKMKHCTGGVRPTRCDKDVHIRKEVKLSLSTWCGLYEENPTSP